MQRQLDQLPQWLDKWRLKVNVSKTQAISLWRRHLPQPPNLMGQPLTWARSIKYLGVTIDPYLSMKYHVKEVVVKTRAARGFLRPVLRSDLLLKAKLAVYKTYIRSRLTYAAPAWCALVKKPERGRMRAQQSLALRTFVDASRFIRNATITRDLRMKSVDVFITRLSRAMFQRADASAFAHIREVAPYHRRPPDGYALPRDLLPVALPGLTPPEHPP
ncbi:putative endonuclease and reverse transcriptase protein [Danaus plexippus plexippus]|uniref:Endonuclease and reverse transcriptase protein n=1 Tax=Danaus plexippus plexippus TaxID=278856 RepID=A0A212EVJ8_DANPL|nr:putative endonuclease and reverse transcriptase protein [Danaus plexippus plexippus]